MAARPVGGRACTRPVVMPGTGLLKYFYNMPDLVIDARLEIIISTGFCPGRFGFFENFVLMFCRDGYDGRSDARRQDLGARRAVRPDGPRAQRAPPRSGGRASPPGRDRAGAARRARGAAKKRAGRRSRVGGGRIRVSLASRSFPVSRQPPALYRVSSASPFVTATAKPRPVPGVSCAPSLPRGRRPPVHDRASVGHQPDAMTRIRQPAPPAASVHASMGGQSGRL